MVATLAQNTPVQDRRAGPLITQAPLALAACLVVVSLLPALQASQILPWSIRAAAAVLAVWTLALRVLHPGGALPSFQAGIRSQHYVQALMQFSVYAYWAYFYAPVGEHAWHIGAQLVFAYGFDMLLSWSRGRSYLLGFGAFPIVFSTNLFLWFKDDWFYLQFLMIAVGLLGKEFIRWERDGKSSHIFNPSAFTLAVFSALLIATGTTEITWGQSIATQLTLAPHIYMYLFAVGLVVMYCFGITAIAAAAAATLFGLSATYAALTGVPYFIDSEIPAAVFLGLHLLVTDPATSPRTVAGKLLFGAGYGVGVFVLYALLGAFGAPTFYDKLLCVPLLNLAVRAIDRWVARWRIGAVPGGNVAHMVVWVAFFLTMTLLGKTDGRQRGDSLPFWQQSCRAGLPQACQRLVKLQTNYCSDNSPWACNELAIHYAQGTLLERGARARQYFSQACELHFAAACNNLLRPDSLQHADPGMLDLRLLLRQRGRNLLDWPEADLRARACEHGWQFACRSAP
jgi:hypothetical protein